MIWTVAQRFSSMAVQFISGIILARLLTPSDYGSIGMLLIFINVSNVFLDGGFGAALIQKFRPTQVDYSTVFWWNLAMSIGLYMILFVIAPFVADFYHMEILSDILRVQALTIIISGFTVVQLNRLKKNLQFKKISIAQFAGIVIGFFVTIVMAYYGFGVWALVSQYLLIALIPSILYWVTDKWYPSLVFSKKSFKELFSFGVFMFFSRIITVICRNMQGLLIGRFYNAGTMGYYTKGKSLEGYATTSISEALSQVTYPLYAEFQNDLTGLASLIKKISTAISFITYPLIFIMILDAKPLILLLYSERWLGSVHYFQILCIAGLATCLCSVNSEAIAAIGKSKLMFKWTVYKSFLTIVFLLCGILIAGMEGLLWAVVLENWLNYIINISLVSKHIGYKSYKQLLDMIPIVSLSLLGYVSCLLFDSVLDLNIYIEAICNVFIFFIVYLGVAKILNIEAMTFAVNIYTSFKMKRNKRN